MNVVLGLGILVFGQVLPGFDPGAGQSAVQPPSGQMDQTDLLKQGGGMQGRSPLTGPMSRRIGEAGGGQEPYVPIAPTDPNLAGNEGWAAPNQAAPGVTPNFGSRARLGSTLGRARTPLSAAMGRAPTSANRNPALAQAAQSNREVSSAAGAPRGSRPFAGYQPAPTQSPYLNMWRSTNNGTVNNYTSLVQPQLEQQQDNGRFGGQIRGLQSATRTQNTALQKLGKSLYNTSRGTMAPEFFMNQGEYFPAFR